MTLSFGVTTQAKTAAAALSANSDDMTKVIQALKDAGVAAADLQTSSVSLSPNTSQDGTQIVGYTASNSVSATIKDIGKAGALIDAAVAAGANQVGGPFLSVSDTDGLYRSALKKAVVDAKAKAQALADAAGLTLGAVTLGFRERRLDSAAAVLRGHGQGGRLDSGRAGNAGRHCRCHRRLRGVVAAVAQSSAARSDADELPERARPSSATSRARDPTTTPSASSAAVARLLRRGDAEAGVERDVRQPRARSTSGASCGESARARRSCRSAVTR